MPSPHPTELPGLTLWLGPGIFNIANDYLDGEGVQDWVNQAVAASVFSQATAAERATFKQAQRHRFPAASFVTDDSIAGGSFSTYFAAGTGVLYVAFFPRNVSTQQYLFEAGSNDAFLRILSSGLLQAGNTDATGTDNVSSAAVAINQWHIGIWHHAQNLVGVGLDSPKLNTTASTATTPTTGTVRFGRRNSAVDPLDALIGELIGFNTFHAELERGKILSWLGSRWQDRGDSLEQARERGRSMVFIERPRDLVDGGVSLFGADFRPLDKVAVTSPQIAPPGAGGDGTQLWERRVMAVLERDIRYRDRMVELRLGDTRYQAHTYRDSGASTKIADPKGEGVMQSGICMARNYFRQSSAYVESAAGTVYRVGPGVEQWESRGSLFENFAQNDLSRSSFVSGETGITPTDNGGTSTMDTGTPKLFKTDVTVNRGKLVTAGGATFWTWPASASIPTGEKRRVSFDYLNVGTDAHAWRLQRSVDSLFWNDSTGAWQAGSVDNTFPLSASIIGRHFSKTITNTNAAAVTYTVAIGFLSGTTSGRTVYLYHQQIAPPWLYSRIVTDNGAASKEAGGVWLYNGESGTRIWPNAQSTVLVRVTPAWDPSDLSTEATIFKVTHDDPSTGTQYVFLRYDPADSKWKLTVRVGGSTWESTFSHTPVRLQEYALTARLVGIGADDITYPAGMVEVGVDGGGATTTAIRSANPTEGIDSRLWYGWSAVPGSFNGWLRDFEIKPFILTTEEVQRWVTL